MNYPAKLSEKLSICTQYNFVHYPRSHSFAPTGISFISSKEFKLNTVDLEKQNIT